MAGDVHVHELVYEKDAQTLSCKSTGGPISTLTWQYNNLILNETDSRYDFTQQLLQSNNTTYNIINNLRIIDKSEEDSGIYTCTIVNDQGMDTSSIQISGQ